MAARFTFYIYIIHYSDKRFERKKNFNHCTKLAVISVIKEMRLKTGSDEADLMSWGTFLQSPDCRCSREGERAVANRRTS